MNLIDVHALDVKFLAPELKMTWNDHQLVASCLDSATNTLANKTVMMSVGYLGSWVCTGCFCGVSPVESANRCRNIWSRNWWLDQRTRLSDGMDFSQKWNYAATPTPLHKIWQRNNRIAQIMKQLQRQATKTILSEETAYSNAIACPQQQYKRMQMIMKMMLVITKYKK